MQEAEQSPEEKQKQKSKYYINIRLSTWEKDSHSLYDYDNAASKIVQKTYELPLNASGIYLFRNKKSHECMLVRNFRSSQFFNEKNNQKIEILAKIKIQRNLVTNKLHFIFASHQHLIEETKKINSIAEEENIKKKKKINFSIARQFPGIVISQEKDAEGEPKGYKLKIGNIIYFGKVKYIVTEIRKGQQIYFLAKNILEVKKKLESFGKDQNQSQQISASTPEKQEVIEDKTQKENSCYSPLLPKTNDQMPQKKDEKINFVQKQAQNQKPHSQEKVQCRICFDTISTPENRLISLCKCTGSCKYLHLKCLKEWMNTKSVIKVREHCIDIQRINCEICRAQIPMNINLEGLNEEIVIVERPKNKDYIILQKLETNSRNVMILKNLPYEGLNIGRDSSCYIQIIDNTVSRKPHAFIKYRGGDFYVYDNNSKFGTIVVEDLEELLKFQVGKLQRAVQIGRTVVNFVVRKQKGILKDL